MRLFQGGSLTLGRRYGLQSHPCARGRTKQLAGAQVVGVQATDLIAEATTAIRAELTATELAQTIHCHPTLAEAWVEAADVLLGEPIHTIAKRTRG